MHLKSYISQITGQTVREITLLGSSCRYSWLFEVILSFRDNPHTEFKVLYPHTHTSSSGTLRQQPSKAESSFHSFGGSNDPFVTN
jgi:hypothetical protein